MLEIQKFLLTHGITALKDKFHIKIKEYDDCLMLNYDQISSRPKDHKIVCQARNLILSKDFLQVYHRSYDRFFNFGENGVTAFPIQESLSFEKIDGSLIGFWFHPVRDSWFACTRSQAFAEGTTTNGTPFYDLIMRALNGKEVNVFCRNERFFPENSYILELVSPESRVVKPYGETKLYLTAIRNKETGRYLSYDNNYLKFCSKVLLKPKIYNFSTVEDCIKFNKENPDPFDEGFVCYDYKTQTHVKIKSPSYLAISKQLNNWQTSIKDIIKIIINNEQDEFLSVFPEYKEKFNVWITAYNMLEQDVLETWKSLANINNQKEFALIAKKYSYASILFEIKKGKSFNDIFRKLNSNSQIILLQKYC